MSSMDKEYVVQNDIAQRYLCGRLTPEEAEAFEVYLLDHPDMREQLELDTLLANGLSRVSIDRPRKRTESKAFLWGIVGAMGGAVFAFFAAFFLILPNSSNIGGASSQIVYLETVRGEPLNNQVNLGAERVVVLVLDTGLNNLTQFSAQMKNAHNTVIETWKGLKSDLNGQAVLLLETSLIDTGSYKITINTSDDQALPITYQLNLEKK